MSYKVFYDLYKRAERLSSAVFLVTNNMSDKNILKENIRQLCIDIISQCALVKDTVKSDTFTRMGTTLMKTASLIDIAAISGQISTMNAGILRNEFDLLIKNLEDLGKYYAEEATISNDFFATKTALVGENQVALNIADDPKNILPYPAIKAVNISVNGKEKNGRKEYRERSIIELIKNRGSVSIKDISKSIKGCSEKTIQRKLADLIDRGIIKRNGERRWSRYSLKSA